VRRSRRSGSSRSRCRCPIDARLPEAQVKRARAALARAKAIGEEYYGVEVATATVRARRAGAAIVEEARRRGVQAIVLAARSPPKVRGGALLGGRAGSREDFVGEVTKHVVTKAPVPGDPHRSPGRRAPVRRPGGDRRGRRGDGRVLTGPRRGLGLESAAYELHPHRGRGPRRLGGRPQDARRSGTRSPSSTRTRCPTSAWTPGRRRPGRTPAAASRRARPRDRRAARGGIEECDVFIAATDGDNTNLTISQIAGRQYEVPRVSAA
jgi:hypothetical protein